MSSRKPLLSIVTVNYNNRNELFQTIESVNYWRSQSPEMIEYIIVDGGSNDLDIADFSRIEKASDIFISEHDNGIYDAMNKGLRTASGVYVQFLNSGDLLINLNVILEKIRVEVETGQKMVLAYRSLVTFGNIGWKMPKHRLFHRLEIPSAHAATVVPLGETKGIEFDVSGRLDADFVWMRQCIKKRSVKVFFDNVAIFRLGGVSNRATFSAQLAKYKINPSLTGLIALLVKPILLFILGYKSYFRVIYLLKYEFIRDVGCYLKNGNVDNSFLNIMNLELRWKK
jgi:putative colanic acid biosynthesis glycosyltransferase